VKREKNRATRNWERVTRRTVKGRGKHTRKKTERFKMRILEGSIVKGEAVGSCEEFQLEKEGA